MRAAGVAGRTLALSALAAACVVGVPTGPARADSVRDSLWHLTALDMPAAWAVTKGAGVTVAVVDSGVDGAQQDLAGSVLAGRNFTGPGDGNTVIGTHGTAMAGLIAGHGHGADGVLGIAPEASILPVVENDTGSAAKAIRWAADNGADVINCSFGSEDGKDSPELRKAIAYALGKDVVVVAGAGNSGGAVGFPGAYDGLISVSGLSKTDTRTPMSAFGPEVDLAAPAADITSTGPGDTYLNAADGTSNSAAIVSGVAALVRAAYPDLDVANVVDRVISTARDLGPAGRDDDFGYGAVDPVAALTREVAPVATNPLGFLEAGVSQAGGSSAAPTTVPPTDSSAATSGQPAASSGEPAAASSGSATDCGVSAPAADCPAAVAAADDSSRGGVPWLALGGGVIVVGLGGLLLARRRARGRTTRFASGPGEGANSTG